MNRWPTRSLTALTIYGLITYEKHDHMVLLPERVVGKHIYHSATGQVRLDCMGLTRLYGVRLRYIYQSCVEGSSSIICMCVFNQLMMRGDIKYNSLLQLNIPSYSTTCIRVDCLWCDLPSTNYIL